MVEVLHESSSPRSPSGSTLRGDGFEYDVFLSFRGADTRKGFTGHLHEALKVRGVETFIDSEKLEKGQKVDELFGYIERSKIFVPVFSKGYADSKWCLKEIAKMVECRRLIIPVFFDVEPRDVRHQTGPFAPAFESYRKNGNIDIEEVSNWADALRQVGEVSGYNLADTEGHEAKLIGLIVKKILTEVNKASLFVTKHGVGLDSRIAEVMKVLELEARDDVRMVGVSAMGGMGKTTLVKAVYNQISSCFGACCFISNVREAARQSSGLVSLQEQLLRSVCQETFYITSIDHGIGIIKTRIQRKMILLILDDVDHESQLDALGGGLEWFGSGSRIIVTTRDRGVLRAPRVKQKGIYELKELDAAQSLELFSWHAFGAGQPVDDFADLAKEVAGTAGGLPLALTIFGSLFFDLKTAKEWCIMLERLKEDQYKDIHERLKISFDALDVKEKNIFLDIAGFFIEQERELATLMWEDCRFFPEITIKVLMHKSLININDDTGEFGMHDHIRDMGRKIVQDESLYNPGMCNSRLWKEDETTDVLQNKKGTKDVEAIKLSRWKFEDPMAVEAKSFAAMPQLRMLLLENNVRLEGEYELFPKTLKWLQWSIPGSLESFPGTGPPENIVILDLSRSYCITQVWNPQTSAGIKVFEKLKVLNLSHCENLMVCPDFTSMPHLERLDFDRCLKLSRLHPSIGHLKCLTHLSLEECVSLKELPRKVGKLASLQVSEKLKFLNLSNCYNLMICPDFTSMPHLEKLYFDCCTKLSRLHPSIGHLKCLTCLYLYGCESLEELPQEVGQLPSLQVLRLDDCWRISTLPSELGDLKSLRRLYLSRTNITTLPESICSLPNLEVLEVAKCRSLASLPFSLGNLRSLRKLDFSGTAIEELPDSMLLLENLEVLRFRYCKRLKVSQASVLIRLMVLKNHHLSFDERSERQHHSQMYRFTELLEALDLEDTLWLMDALAIDESELLETRRIGINLHGLLRKRFQEENFQHLLNWLIPRSLPESSHARSLFLVLPQWFARGRLFLILNESSQLDSVVVHMNIKRICDGRLLFQTSTEARAWRFSDDDDDILNQVPQVKLQWHDDGCLSRLVMHVSISGCLPIDGYLGCSNIDGVIPSAGDIRLNFDGPFPRHCGLVVLGISVEVHHAACNTEDKLEAREL